jgi:hypothetical protein
LNLADFLDGMRADNIFYELDSLGAVLSQEVCVGFERGEVVFSRSALVGAEGNACLVQFGEGFGDGLDAGVVEYLMCRRVEGNVDVDSEKDPLVSRFYVVKRKKIIFSQMRVLSSFRPGLGFCLMICNAYLVLRTYAGLTRSLVVQALRRRVMPVTLFSGTDRSRHGFDSLALRAF